MAGYFWLNYWSPTQGN